jgi:hypothetical protein
MALKKYNDIIARIASGYWAAEPFYGNRAVAAANVDLIPSTGWNAANNRPWIVGWVRTTQSLPAGVTAYILSEVSLSLFPNRPVLLAELVNLGSIDISGASGTFTDGSVMPTETELGASVVKFGPVLVEVTAALNATPGSLTVTYTNQDGTTLHSSGALVLGASCGVGQANFLTLAAGDYGVRDITAAARSGGTTPAGTLKFWGVIPIVQTGIPTGGAAVSENLLLDSCNPRRIGAGKLIAAIQLGATSSQGVVFGSAFLVGDN